MVTRSDSRTHILSAGFTDRGKERDDNQDAWASLHISYRMASRNDESQAVPVVVAIVADGMGGEHGGKVAADLAVTVIGEQLSRNASRPVLDHLEDALRSANDAIYDRAMKDPLLANMGTTVAVAVVVGERLYVAHVGDSRVYLVRNDRIHLLTEDHTLVQQGVAAGHLTVQQASKHPNRHLLSRYLGQAKHIDVDLEAVLPRRGNWEGAPQKSTSLRLRGDDIVLVCSDGLTDKPTASDLLNIITKYRRDLPRASRELIKLANDRDGSDNSTAVLVGIFEQTEEIPETPPYGERLMIRSWPLPRRFQFLDKRLLSTIVVLTILLIAFVAISSNRETVVAISRRVTGGETDTSDIRNRPTIGVMPLVAKTSDVQTTMPSSTTVPAPSAYREDVLPLEVTSTPVPELAVVSTPSTTPSHTAEPASPTVPPTPSVPPVPTTPRPVATWTPRVASPIASPAATATSPSVGGVVPTAVTEVVDDPVPSSVPSPSIVAPRQLSLVLRFPAPDEVTHDPLIRFRVTANGMLSGERVELLMGQEPSLTSANAVPVQWVLNGSEWEATLDNPFLGYGVYYWTVAIMGVDGVVVSEMPPARKLSWNAPLPDEPDIPPTEVPELPATKEPVLPPPP